MTKKKTGRPPGREFVQRKYYLTHEMAALVREHKNREHFDNDSQAMRDLFKKFVAPGVLGLAKPEEMP